MFLRAKKSLVLLGALVWFSPLDNLLNAHFITGAFADSEAASEAPMTGGRGRRGYWRYQQQQQRMAAQQARQQQQMQNQQRRKQNGFGGQRNKPFKVSDYIHEYGSGRSKGNFHGGNLSGANSSNGRGLSSSAGQAVGGSSSGNLSSTNSVPFQKFPPK